MESGVLFTLPYITIASFICCYTEMQPTGFTFRFFIEMQKATAKIP